MAEEFKSKGNEAFKAGNMEGAVENFSKAIDADPKNAVYYSNRSMVYATMGNFEKALEDGLKCIELKPEWPKSYTRAGLAYFKLGKLEEAKKIYLDGSEKCPDDQGLKDGYKSVLMAEQQAKMSQTLITQLLTNPKTRELISKPGVLQKIMAVFGGQRDPSMTQEQVAGLMQDEDVQACMEVLLGGMMQGGQQNPFEKKENPIPKKEEKEEKPEPKPEKELDPKQKEELEKRKLAEAEKEKGNECFKKRKFEDALSYYEKALSICPKEILYFTNRAAALYNLGKYDEAIEECKEGIKVGKESGTNFKNYAKAYARIGECYLKLDQFDTAVEYFDKSLLEYFSDKVKMRKDAVLKRKKQKEEEDYINPEKAEEHKSKGGEYFKNGKFKEAIEEYDEALRRDPKNYKIRSNRSLAYMKLMQWTKAIDDCDEVIKCEKTFIKAYIRKATVQKFLKQYNKALQTIKKGLDIEPNNVDLKQAYTDTMIAIRNSSSGDVDQAQVNEAMKDPEIQNIMKDPFIMNLLQNMGKDPAMAAKAMADPQIRDKVEKLIAAGIVRTG